MKPEPKIPVSALRAQAEAMLANGTLPSLEKLLEAVFSTRAVYAPKILAAQRGRKQRRFD